MLSDKIEEINGSRIQHGKLSDRVYLMELSRRSYPGIVEWLDDLAELMGYSKIFAKVPDWALPEFERAGHSVEARVPGMFGGKSDGCFTAKYTDVGREIEKRPEVVEDVLKAAEERPVEAAGGIVLPQGLELHEAEPGDAENMAGVYRDVFDTYPFPIHDPSFLEDAIEEGDTRFFVVRDGEDIAALASSEIDMEHMNAEMTDFATLTEYRGRGLASFLLKAMEDEMRELGLKVLYTIARAYSFGMNITFSKLGYECGGTLTNNTNISGGLESMNVWFKVL